MCDFPRSGCSSTAVRVCTASSGFGTGEHAAATAAPLAIHPRPPLAFAQPSILRQCSARCYHCWNRVGLRQPIIRKVWLVIGTSTGNVNPEIGKIRGNDTKRKIDVAGRLLARARA